MKTHQESLEELLIDLYESGLLHGEAAANGVLPTTLQRESTIIIVKSRLLALINNEKLDEIKITIVADMPSEKSKLFEDRVHLLLRPKPKWLPDFAWKKILKRLLVTQKYQVKP